MFGEFSERMDSRTRRRMAASVLVSLLLYGGGGAAVVFAANAVTPEAKKDKEVEVTFYKAIPEPPPLPAPEPPPPALEPPPPPPDVPPPPVPPPPKVRRGAKPPPAPPKKMPVKAAPEADPTNEAPKPLVAGDLPTQWGDPNGKSDEGKVFGDPDGVPDAPPAPPAPPPPVILPAGAQAPEVIGSLVSADDYPRTALSARLEGTVIVKVAVQVDGTVRLVKFLKRDANFDDAVLAILKRLRFKPAVYNGKPIAVYQNLKFPFTIQ